MNNSSSLDELPLSARSILDYRGNCWKFMSECVWTQDQVDKSNPVKKYPDDDSPKGPYLKYMVNKMVIEQLLAVVKNRRMIQTWSMCGVGIWDAMFFEGRKIAFISKKEEDSDELVRRCEFIYDNIPKELLPVKPEKKYKFCHLEFPELKSEIIGVAQGPDQLRQHTCSRIFADEIGFWEKARSTFVAMKPTLDGGGQVCLCSTRFPGFFKQLIEDSLDS